MPLAAGGLHPALRAGLSYARGPISELPIFASPQEETRRLSGRYADPCPPIWIESVLGTARQIPWSERGYWERQRADAVQVRSTHLGRLILDDPNPNLMCASPFLFLLVSSTVMISQTK